MSANQEIEAIVRRVLAEDIGDGDVSTDCTVEPDAWLHGGFLAKADGVIAGLEIVALTFRLLDERVTLTALVQDGERVNSGQTLATVTGPARALLSGERTALNLLQRMSGIASAARCYVDAVAGTEAVILDTRKTAPGLRVLDKLAVRLGGATNHRAGLYDMVMIKDNHIAACGGSLSATVARVRAGDVRARPIEVEVRTFPELEEALTLGVDRIMLDNMGVDDLRRAVRIVDGRTPLEASGNVTLATVRTVAETGVNFVSIGALTHSVTALDISLWLDTPR
jgi:nicotinate-nucleotide pyrophosphorylase (carboxylating)